MCWYTLNAYVQVTWRKPSWRRKLEPGGGIDNHTGMLAVLDIIWENNYIYFFGFTAITGLMLALFW